jgi:hypothetical protein
LTVFIEDKVGDMSVTIDLVNPFVNELSWGFQRYLRTLRDYGLVEKDCWPKIQTASYQILSKYQVYSNVVSGQAFVSIILPAGSL